MQYHNPQQQQQPMQWHPPLLAWSSAAIDLNSRDANLVPTFTFPQQQHTAPITLLSTTNAKATCMYVLLLLNLHAATASSTLRLTHWPCLGERYLLTISPFLAVVTRKPGCCRVLVRSPSFELRCRHRWRYAPSDRAHWDGDTC